MSFNCEPIKQSREIIFTRKIAKKTMSHWFLNNSVSEVNLQKQALLSITVYHLGTFKNDIKQSK